MSLSRYNSSSTYDLPAEVLLFPLRSPSVFSWVLVVESVPLSFLTRRLTCSVCLPWSAVVVQSQTTCTVKCDAVDGVRRHFKLFGREFLDEFFQVVCGFWERSSLTQQNGCFHGFVVGGNAGELGGQSVDRLV